MLTMPLSNALIIEKTPLQLASESLNALDAFPQARRIDWNILRSKLLTHLFSVPHILLRDLITAHDLHGIMHPSIFHEHPELRALVFTPAHEQWVDVERLRVADMESALVEGSHIDLGWIGGSQKREVISRILMRCERMRDAVLGAGTEGDEVDRLWVLGRYLIELMKKKYEESGSMGMGGKTGPLPALSAAVTESSAGPGIVVSDENANPITAPGMGHLHKSIVVVTLPMRANEVL